MELVLQQPEYNKIIAHAEQGYPHEVVGILGGDRQNNRVQAVKMLINEKGNTTNRYKVGALALMRAEQELERSGFEIVGYYHSHPDHPSQYSKHDLEQALPNMSYLIVSIINGQGDNLQSWRLTEDRSVMTEEKIILTPQ